MPNLGDYTVGWICAIQTEFVAAQAFLDESHDDPEGVAPKDDNNYALGRMGKHNVVIATLPKGEYGTTTAATVARDMVHSFPNVRIGLMVGIAGGAPSQKHDIRLGDIVVSGRGGGEGGVFQYDYGKTVQNGSFEGTGRLNQSPQILLTAVNGLGAYYELNGNQLDSKVEEVLGRRPLLRNRYSRPHPITDRLYVPNATHPLDSRLDCHEVCSSEPPDLVIRPERDDHESVTVHVGLIASGNQVMKDAYIRDHLAAEKDVLCFEMEAAGLMNHFPCLIVRGICDYSDSHKNKAWQGFAAMVAAAYAKDLLGRVSSTRIEMETKLRETLRSIETNLTQHLHEVTARTTEIVLNERAEAVKRWLSPPDSSTNANHARELRHEGTGKWFLESAIFKEWECGLRQHLWLYGLPGCGKTVLLSSAYDHVDQVLDHIALQFFFDFSDERKQTVEHMLRGLIFQLYTLQPEPTAELDVIFRRCNDGRSQPGSGALSDCLHRMLKGPRTVYIFIDALDECCERSKLLDWITTFMAIPDLGHIKLIMTARPEADLTQRIRSLIQDINCVSLQTVSVNADIQSYVQSSLNERPGFKKWMSSPSMLQKINCEVGGKADGMFRWAACQLDSLESCVDQEEIEEALLSLPASLNETYERILGKIKENRKHRSMRLLQFLVFSPQPITLSEAVGIIAVRPQGFQAERRMPDPDDILQFCPGLISIVQSLRRSRDDYTSYKSTEVHLAHFSVKEYLLTIPRDFEPIHASVNILRTSFIYYSSVQKSALYPYLAKHIDVAKDFPLMHFIFMAWMSLVLVAEEPEDIVEQAADILQDSRNIALWKKWDHPFGTLRPDGTLRPEPLEKHGLYYACRKKLSKTARALMLRNVGIDTRDGYMAALQAASYSGLLDIVQKLLHMDSRSDDEHETYGSALQVASKEGHQEIVEMLLSHGAGINSRKNKFCDASALLSAARNGHTDIVKLLLVNGADINVDDDDDDALLAAPRNGFRDIVDLLLRHGADVKSHGQALIYASERGHDEIVRLLLDYRVDVNAADVSSVDKALLGVSKIGHLNIATQLVNHGADVNARSGNLVNGYSAWNTPLLIASDHGHAEFARFLVDHGADVNAQGGDEYSEIFDWTTALQKSSFAGCLEMVRLLLENGADVNAQNPNGNALTAAILADRHQKEIVKLLLGRGARANAHSTSGHMAYGFLIGADYDQCSPLSTAIWVNRPDLVRLLLDHESDVNGPMIDSKYTGEPLDLAFSLKGRAEIIQQLIESGADPNQLYKQGYPIICLAVERGDHDIVKLLVKFGADLNPEGFGLEYLVSTAFKRGEFDLALYLMQTGADRNIPREEGYLRGRIPLGFIDWAAQFEIPDIPELREEIIRLRSPALDN